MNTPCLCGIKLLFGSMTSISLVVLVIGLHATSESVVARVNKIVSTTVLSVGP